MASPTIILRPDRVALVRPRSAPVVLGDVAVLSVLGGEPVKGDSRFSHGYRRPSAVGVILVGGARRRIDDAQLVLVAGGGVAAAADPMQQVMQDLLGASAGSLRVSDGGVGLGEIDLVQPASEYIDDVDAYLRAKANAAAAVGGDEFRTHVQMQSQRHALLAAQNPNTPASAVKAVKGNIATVSQGDLPKIVAYWNGDNTECQPVTCMFATVQTAQARAAGTAQRVYGIVQFGTEGFLTFVEVDINLGVQFVVSGSQVTLQVAVEQSATPVQMTGMMSFKAITKFAPVTRTRYLDSVPAAVGDQAAGLGIVGVLTAGAGFVNGGTIPPYAKSVTVWRDDVSQPIIVNFYGTNGGGLLFRLVLAAGQDMSESPPIVLTGDVGMIRLQNWGTKAINARLIFHLEF